MAYKKAKSCRGKPCGTCDDQTRTHKITKKGAYAVAYAGIGGGGMAAILFFFFFEATGTEGWEYWLLIFAAMWIYGHIAMNRAHKKGTLFEPREVEEDE